MWVVGGWDWEAGTRDVLRSESRVDWPIKGALHRNCEFGKLISLPLIEELCRLPEAVDRENLMHARGMSRIADDA